MDSLAWLKNRKDPKVIDFLIAENMNTEKFMNHTKSLQTQIYTEIVSRIKETDISVPYKKGPYHYYTRTAQGQSYEIYCRKKDCEHAQEEIILDINLLAQDNEYLDIGDMEISYDHNLLLYSLDTNGSESYTIYVKDLVTNTPLLDFITETEGTFVWAQDPQTFFYVTLDKAHRPYKVFRHKLGTHSKEDVMVFHETDESFYVSVNVSKDHQFIFISSDSKTTSEAYYLNAHTPCEPFQLIQARQPGVEYSVYHYKDQFLIITNENAQNFKIMQTPVAAPKKKHWIPFLPYDSDRRIETLEIFDTHIAIFERYQGLTNVRMIEIITMQSHDIVLPETAHFVGPEHNDEISSNALRIRYESPVTPSSIYDYYFQTKHLTLLKQKEIPGGYDKTHYQVEHVFSKAPDDVEIPITILRKKDILLNGGNPVLLTGYGAYEISKEPYFISSWFSLIDRGFVVAIAHIRGGGEKGRAWYENGKLLKKKNTFIDFIVCAEYLVDHHYTLAGKIAIMGGSAGGLLMAAVTNMRPDLWGAVIADVPFTDVVNTMLDSSLPLTVTEYDEWGNPNESEYLEYMKSYSPYDNVKKQNYPPILATAGLHDPRVGFWEPAKWICRIKELRTNNNPLLLKTEMNTGHAGPSGRYKKAEEQAFHYSFVIQGLLNN